MNEQVLVLRGQYGLAVSTFVSDVVVGDIVLLNSGDRVPADCLLIEEMDMKVDERIYYPEKKDPQEKQASQDGGNNHLQNPDPILLAGSLIMEGSGKAVVLAVGKSTLREKELKEDIIPKDEQQDSHLEGKLRILANIFGAKAKIFAFFAFVLFTIFWLSKILYTEESISSNESLQSLLKNLQIAVALLIVSVPEGMPLVISIAIAFSTENLKKEFLHVKNNKALELSGSIVEVVTGKTNTLTTGDLEIDALYLGGTLYEKIMERSEANQPKIDPEVKKIFTNCILLNSDARMEMSDTNEKNPMSSPQYFPSGSAVEVGLFKYLMKHEKDVPIQSILVERERKYKLKTVIPFSTERKMMTVAYELPGNKKVRVVVKGAPEFVIPKCTHSLGSKCEEELFDGDGEQGNLHLKRIVTEKIAIHGYKSLSIAYRDFDRDDFNTIYHDN